MARELNYSEEQKRCLARIGAMGYTVGNYLPQECTWKLSPRDIIEIANRISSPYLSDIDKITLGAIPVPVKDEDGKRTMDVPVAYIWLPKNSPNLVDRSLDDTNSAIKIPIPSVSKNLKEFGSKFCLNGKLHIVDGKMIGFDQGRRVSSGKKYKGIVALVEKFLIIEFDSLGIQYSKEFGDEFKRMTNIIMDPIDLKELPHGDMAVNQITVKKSERRTVEKEIRPTRSHNIF